MKEEKRKQTEKTMLSVVVDLSSQGTQSQILCPRMTDHTRDLQFKIKKETVC